MTGNLSNPYRVSERDEAIALANRVLDRVNADPDDDLALLSRRFLREIERAEAAEKDARRLDWIMPILGGDDTKEADRRALALAAQLVNGLSGRDMIDAAMKAG